MDKKKSVTKPKKKSDNKETNKESINLILSDLKIGLKYKNETQKILSNSIKKNDVTICLGPAGTGKTILTVFEAINLLKQYPDVYKEIKLVKSMTQLKNEDLGTLPGDEKDKLKFLMMSYLDAFYKLIGEYNTNKLIEAGLIKMEVFGSIRGRSFSNAIIIVDEFQNITHNNAKTFLTRFSDNTKVIVLGDVGQIDLKDRSESSLERLATKVRQNTIDGVNVVEFNESEIVRHRLTSYFVNIFNETEQNKSKLIIPKKKKTSFFGKILKFFK